MKRAALLFLIGVFCVSCGRLHGEFAFRQGNDKGYKRILSRLEFDSGENVDWIYSFQNASGKRSIGVIFMKKELGWVDIMTSRDYIDETKQIVYGNIQGFEPGEYKLVLTEITLNGGRKIDEKEFYIYSDEEPPEGPSD